MIRFATPFLSFRRPCFALLALGAIVAGSSLALPARANERDQLPAKDDVLATLRRVNGHFMSEWPDPGKDIVTNQTRPSNIWTRAVYYEGLMALHTIDRDPKYIDYAVRWGEHHKWNMRYGGARNGQPTRNADDQCCGQTYIDLYAIDPKPERIAAIQANIDHMVASERANDWTWIDALQMSMPVFAKLGALTGDEKYFEKMHALYLDARDKQGGHGLFNPEDGLWWRDRNFVAPYKEPNGEDCYWSRGNGWVAAALARVLEALPADGPHRGEYIEMLRTMCAALKKVQREDGFWNVSLHDPTHFGGKETSGTALFTYAMAWGVRTGVLPRDEYLPVVAKGWNAIATDAVHPDGFLGFVQGTGKEPKDGQPVTYDSKPDFDDYGAGCVLLAGTEVYRLAK